ncbi:hypothetical protein AGABI1DRAFT_114374 [Agaricus bisporus var. burnettii JB137-S8]|uniref:G domain-containing protein n=1 Tax=Agaricus bisporus var. burnettii (strain JB137-S8 / ATCC MYA-4627 / FGSC 10392) TaxID=597362 RepID=K5X736_AGABU|nr:uncharacterized protein AGABI1DRAFT_114374 [Agaricus bisporus var. burnettii JB137-S8]EKM78782.1 hypothetical protein AGABI1DRAFT_114374 [Agaricus bisporus var. burnettii JB137-S8]
MGSAISSLLPTIDNIQQDDITIIAVVGQTGVGKSTFINTAAGKEILTIGHGLRPHTLKVQHVECSNPKHYGNRKVIFVDTPAFDAVSEEKLIEEKLKTWLKSISKKLRISGILYLHRITDGKLTDPPIIRLALLQELCKDSSRPFPNRVAFVTTMWGKLRSEDVGRQREEELQKHWDKVPRGGGGVSRIMRFEDSFDSAWSIVLALIEEGIS